MEKESKTDDETAAVAINLLAIGVLVVIVVSSGVLSNTSPQLLIDAIFGIASVTIALATVSIYLRQNEIIDEQTKATIQARKASIQTLDMAATDSGRDLVVELSNSGGGAARELRGKVKFEVPESYNLDIETYTAPVDRKSMTKERSGSRTWLASEGNTIAADEKQVPVEIQCAVQFPGQEHASGFRSGVRKITDSWKYEQLSKLESVLSAEKLETVGDRWDEQVFIDMADSSTDPEPGDITKETVVAIATTLADSDSEVSESDILEREVRLRIWIEYVDEYLDNIGQEATVEADVLDATFEIKRDIKFSEIFDDDKRTSRRNRDPEGSALRT